MPHGRCLRMERREGLTTETLSDNIIAMNKKETCEQIQEDIISSQHGLGLTTYQVDQLCDIIVARLGDKAINAMESLERNKENS